MYVESEESFRQSKSTDDESASSNDKASNPYSGFSGLQSGNTAPEGRLITEEQAKLFTEVLNVGNHEQLCFLVSGSMYEDPQQIKDSLRKMWKASYKRMHFLFRVKDLDAGVDGKKRSIISATGQEWGYLSFSVSLTSTRYGSLLANLPSNLLQFFSPVFVEVAQLTGMRMSRNPPRPASVPFARHVKDEDDTEGI